MDSVLLFLSRLLGRPHDLRVADARESLTYWSRRADDLPWHRRAERREARERTTAARAQLVGAHLGRTRLGTLAPRVTPLLDTRGRSPVGHARSLALVSMRRTAIGRKILLAAAGAAIAAVALAAVVTALAVHFVL